MRKEWYCNLLLESVGSNHIKTDIMSCEIDGSITANRSLHQNNHAVKLCLSNTMYLGVTANVYQLIVHFKCMTCYILHSSSFVWKSLWSQKNMNIEAEKSSWNSQETATMNGLPALAGNNSQWIRSPQLFCCEIVIYLF